MLTAYRSSKIVRPTLRAVFLAAFFVGPFAGFSIAASNDNGAQNSGAGFVLYVSLMRP